MTFEHIRKNIKLIDQVIAEYGAEEYPNDLLSLQEYFVTKVKGGRKKRFNEFFY